MTATATTNALSLARSRNYCEQLTRSAARNFYYGLRLLPEPKRSAMFALYAYMRRIDDIADNEDGRPLERRSEQLDAWRQTTHDVLHGASPTGDGRGDNRGEDHLLWPALAEMVHRYQLPHYLFDDAVAGQKQDLADVSFDTFGELHDYCYRVAGVVGLASIYIWGFEGGRETERQAVERGVAFQLTNILRDLREDAGKGRTYLPAEELHAMSVTVDDLRQGRGGKHFKDLMHFQIARAEAFYDKSATLESRISRDSRPTLCAMTEIYRGLLRKVARHPERVLRERVSLSLFSKLRIGWRASRSRLNLE
jgi:phytoene synthase